MRNTLILLLILLIGGTTLLVRKMFSISPFTNHCPFCNEAILTRQKFYEDELVLALVTHKPSVPGHLLIIPKRHIERFEMLTDEELVQIGRIIKKANLAAMKVFVRVKATVVAAARAAPFIVIVPHNFERVTPVDLLDDCVTVPPAPAA